VAQREPAGDFDYLWEDLSDREFDGDEFIDDSLGLGPDESPPVPWYRTTQAMIAIAAIGCAVIAILVSAVLLVSRQSRGPADTVERPVISTSSANPTSTATTVVSSAPPAPETSPSQPPSSTASVIVQPPPPPPKPTATNPPQVQVTRTPSTRSPISVQPAPHPAFPHY
jgi:hypothetical protein